MRRVWRSIKHRLGMRSGVIAPCEFVTNKYKELGFRQGDTVYWFKQFSTPVIEHNAKWEALPPKVVRCPTERIQLR